ncbi:MAG: TRAP transporter large permease subunit [Salinarimonadaceae bacterium]|nr:MAG: TRAP transporter large permease subunit [Salinarimonadaceae bacterium]
MDMLPLSLALIGLLFLIIGLGVWIGVALATLGFVALVIQLPIPPGTILATSVWQGSKSWDLTALPMFILMGDILFRTRLSQDMFDGLAPWLSRLPGRLLHVNIVGSTVFAAVSGSSAATCATIGRISLGELKKRGYSEGLSIGTLAGSGTIGLMIPPSIILIVYAAATELSVARLFIAGVVPGLMLTGMFMAFVIVWALINRSKMPPPDAPMPFFERVKALRRLAPILLLIIGVIGSIYTGIASPTEAAVVGVFLSLAIAWRTGTLTLPNLRDALVASTKTSCMIIFILAGAAFLTTAMGFTGIPRVLAEWIAGFGLSQAMLLLALTVFFIIMGCFLDGISMVVLTTSIILPLVTAAGFDLIWFGIYIVLVVEMAQITPPVGFNLYVLQSLTGRNIFTLGWYALPFFLLMCLAALLLAMFPDIALWLPRTMLE